MSNPPDPTPPADTATSLPSRSRLAPKLMLSVFSLALAILALEIGFRHLASIAPETQPHDRPLITFYPSAERLNPWTRGESDPLRIAVVGDSITHGAGCQFYDTYGMRLEAMMNMNAGQRPVEVRVWARGGDNTQSQLRYLNEIIPWQPSLLILGICLNDTEDWNAREEFMRWRMEMLPTPPPPWLAPLLSRSALGARIYQRHAARKAREGYLNYYRRLFHPEYSGWVRFTRAIGQFDSLCRENNITFVPVIFPMVSDLDRYPFEDIHKQIAREFDRQGMGYLDLLDTFRGQCPRRLQAIPLVDAHPNEIGHRLAAEAIFMFLLANQLVEEEYMPQHANLSPGRMWGIMQQFLHRVVDVDPDLIEYLIESEPAPDFE